MDHNDGQDNVKDVGTAKTVYKTNGQRCQKPRLAKTNRRKCRWRVEVEGTERWWENEWTM